MHTRVELDCPLGQRHFESHWAQATVKPDKTDDTLNTNHYHLLRAIHCESRKKNPLRYRSGFSKRIEGVGRGSDRVRN